MKDYKENLAYQPLLTQNIISCVDDLLSGAIKKQTLHSRKSYSRAKGYMITCLEYAIALEIFYHLEEGAL